MRNFPNRGTKNAVAYDAMLAAAAMSRSLEVSAPNSDDYMRALAWEWAFRAAVAELSGWPAVAATCRMNAECYARPLIRAAP